MKQLTLKGALLGIVLLLLAIASSILTYTLRPSHADSPAVEIDTTP